MVLPTGWLVRLSLLNAAVSAQPEDARPTTDAHGVACDAPPPIISYHVHGAWNARDVTLSREAQATFKAFAESMGSPAQCPFSHANAAGFYARVCEFPFDWATVAEPTNATSGLFGDMNHAFFVPPAMYVEAMDWWRQRRGRLHYMMHANTGCEYEDHSAWSMVSNDYPAYDQSLEGLWCCKRGPPSCSCGRQRRTYPGLSSERTRARA